MKVASPPFSLALQTSQKRKREFFPSGASCCALSFIRCYFRFVVDDVELIVLDAFVADLVTGELCFVEVLLFDALTFGVEVVDFVELAVAAFPTCFCFWLFASA